MLGVSYEAEEELKKGDVKFHHYPRKGRQFDLDSNVEDHHQKIKENYFHKNEEDHFYLYKTSKSGKKKRNQFT